MEENQRYTGSCPMMKPFGRMDGFPIAMAYVPWQNWHSVYDLERALSAGTIFPELNKPFLGVRRGCR